MSKALEVLKREIKIKQSQLIELNNAVSALQQEIDVKQRGIVDLNNQIEELQNAVISLFKDDTKPEPKKGKKK